MLAAEAVFTGVVEQLSLVATGETTAMTVAYMTNAVVGMHGEFIKAIDINESTRGGCAMISKPTTQQLIDAACTELAAKVAPAVTDSTAKLVLDMAIAGAQGRGDPQRQRTGLDARRGRCH